MYKSINKLRLVLSALLLFLKAGQAISKEDYYNDEFCGFQHIDGRRSSEGLATNKLAYDEFPWVAALIYKDSCNEKERILCSGALITTQLVLTAAQCVLSPKTTQLDRVRLGDYDISNKTDCYIEDDEDECIEAVEIQIDKILVHDQYDPLNRVNDIALLRLEKSITYTDYIRTICLSKESHDSKNPYYISGWGAIDSQNPTQSRIKKKIVSELVSSNLCKNLFKTRTVNTQFHICTEDMRDNEAFTSIADAGAPLMVSHGKGRWLLEGIFSWTAIGNSKPRVHTRVASYSQWIISGIESLTPYCIYKNVF